MPRGDRDRVDIPVSLSPSVRASTQQPAGQMPQMPFFQCRRSTYRLPTWTRAAPKYPSRVWNQWLSEKPDAARSSPADSRVNFLEFSVWIASPATR